jgi:hypothetical protein
MKAFSRKDWFDRWGIHYLRYFVRSHQLQVCSNFKDQSLQNYGGQLFLELRQEIEEIFAKMPPPTPSRVSHGQTYQGNFKQSFYNPSGPCFDGNGIICMWDGSLKKVKDIRKGDQFYNNIGKTITILCVIKTKVKNGMAEMVKLNDIMITPWHPVMNAKGFIRSDCSWKFPSELKKPEMVQIDYMYDFVLDSHHIVNINGLDVITLGHGYVDNPYLAHNFFGTHLVIDNLMKHKGWKDGLIEFDEYLPKYNDQGEIISFF